MEKLYHRHRLLAHLSAERAALLEQLLGLSKASLTDKPVYQDTPEGSSEAWSVKDILSHIAAWDRWEERTMQAMVAGEQPDFSKVQDFTASNAAFVAAWRDRTLDEMVAELMSARADWVAFLDELSNEEFSCPRAYYGHDWTFSDIPLPIQWRHDAEHAEQIAVWRKTQALGKEMGPKSVLLAALDGARAELLAAAALIPSAERTLRPICGDWTLKDVLGHIADWEFYGTAGLRQMADGHRPDPEPLGSIESWNVSHAEARRDEPWEVVWEDLHTARRELREVLDGMSRAAIGQPFAFPWGQDGTPYDWVRIFLSHDREHAHELREVDDAH
jgi:uncharacterized damage-inducible protein DinB